MTEVEERVVPLVVDSGLVDVCVVSVTDVVDWVVPLVVDSGPVDV
mgnify:CR=1 FL=1